MSRPARQLLLILVVGVVSLLFFARGAVYVLDQIALEVSFIQRSR